MIDYRKQTRLPARGQANGSTSAPTSTNASFVLIPEMTVTITTQGGDVLVTFTSSFNLQSGDNWDFAIYTDSSLQTGTQRHVEFHGGSLIGLTPATFDGYATCITFLVTGLAAGSHTFEARWSRAAGTARCVGTQRNIVALEVF